MTDLATDPAAHSVDPGHSVDPAERLADEVARRLRAALEVRALAVINDSHLHAGHAGDDGSGVTHWTVELESPAFAGLGRVARHRLVNAALGDLIGAPIHALVIRARAPGEA